MYQEKSPVSSLHSSVLFYNKIVKGNILCSSRRTHGKLKKKILIDFHVSVCLVIDGFRELSWEVTGFNNLTNVKKFLPQYNFFHLSKAYSFLDFFFYVYEKFPKRVKRPSEW